MHSATQSRSHPFTAVLIGWLLIAFAAHDGTTTTAFADANAHNTTDVAPPSSDLTTLSLEQLMMIDVTSVSKKREPLSHAAAAIFVITQEDIRRSGITSLPEALRMVPGVQVARLDSSKWAVSARGFNSRLSNKMLVLVDGQNIYNAFFAGTLWETTDTFLDDIERIEVIRGPGAALWGVNAVNGVVNVITKRAHDTHGGMVSALGGTEEGIGGIRYGGQLNDDFHYRVFGKYLNRDTTYHRNGAHDDWRIARGGFRTDWDFSAGNTLTTLGGLYEGDIGQQTAVSIPAPPFSQLVNEDSRAFGGNLLTRWEHTISDTSDFALQFFYDRFERDEPYIKAVIDTWDVDFQHRFALPFDQDVVWGLGYRYWADDYQPTFMLRTIPSTKTYSLLSGFLQDTVGFFDNALHVTLGSKFSHNDFTGFEIQPSARVSWDPPANYTLWAAVSRSVRVPSRAADNLSFVRVASLPGITLPYTLQGNQQLQSESVVSLEAGYRVTPSSSVSFDVTGFYNIHDKLLSLQQTAPLPTPAFQFVNVADARVYGIEVSNTIQVQTWWQLRGAYTYLKVDIDNDPGAFGVPYEDETASPEHQVSVRSLMNLPHDIEVDAWLRFIDSLQRNTIPSYTQLDLRIGWKPWSNLDLSLVGQNLLDKQQPEFNPTLLPTQNVEIQRSVYARMTWKF